MKIAIITETFLPSTNGVVTRVTASIRWLVREGHDVLVIAPDPGIAEFEGARVWSVPAYRFFLYKDLRVALPSAVIGKALREFQPDLVHVVNPALLGIAGIWYGRRYPLVASYHTNIAQYADFYKAPWMKPVVWRFLRWLHNQADLNLCTSNAVLEELTARKFKNVRLWKRGVDVNLFGPQHRNAKMRERLSGGRPDKRLLLYVGRLAAEKQIEGIRDVLLASGDTTLAIVGDGPHRKALEEHFAGTDTTFVGFLHGEELAQAYASSDLFVFPSTTETLGLVLLEAMASGLPVVAAASGPSKEQIEPGVTGFLFDPAKPGDFVETTLSALRDGEQLRRMGEAASRSAAEFGWDRPSRQLLDFYVSVTRAAAGPARPVKKKDLFHG